MSILQYTNTKNKKIIYVLKSVLGIGYNKANLICQSLGIDNTMLWSDLTSQEKNKLDSIVTLKHKFKIEVELKKYNYDNIQTLKNIKSYKGIRHFYNLPVNGQRTHTNAKSNKKKRK